MSDIEVRENLSDPQAEGAQQDSAPQTYEGVDTDGLQQLRTPVEDMGDPTSDPARLEMIERSKVKISPDATTADATGPFDTTHNWESEPTTQGDTWEYPKPAKTSDAVGGISPNPWEGGPIDDEE